MTGEELFYLVSALFILEEVIWHSLMTHQFPSKYSKIIYTEPRTSHYTPKKKPQNTSDTKKTFLILAHRKMSIFSVHFLSTEKVQISNLRKDPVR